MLKSLKIVFAFYMRRYILRYGALSGFINFIVSTILQFHVIFARKSALKSFVIADDESKIIGELKVNGYSIININQLDGFAEVFNLLKNVAEKNTGIDKNLVGLNNHGKSTKTHWIDIFPESIYDRKIIFDFLCSKKFITIIGNYLGEIPYFEYCSYFYSPFGLSAKEEASQLWHKDRDQYNKIKLFYSPFGMDESNGCTKLYLHKIGKYKLYPNYPWYFSDEEAANAGWPSEKITNVVLSSDEIAIVDTALLVHKGSDKLTSDRLLLIASFGGSQSRLKVKEWRKIQANSINYGA